MKLYYISPSVLPSRTANSIHVIQQCSAFNKIRKIRLTLFARRSLQDENDFFNSLESIYGVRKNDIRFATFYNRLPFADNLFICFYSIYFLLKEKWPDVIISRNLYASFILAVIFKEKVFYETHELEKGIYNLMQKLILRQKKVKTIIISQKLKFLLCKHHNANQDKMFVLHDAAPEGIQPIPPGEKRSVLTEIFPKQLDRFNQICGYFGHLYPGRGIRIITELAERNTEMAFLIVGGNDSDVEALKNKILQENIIFKGFLPHSIAQRLMAACDVLLMPYQEKVSIGSQNRDTAQWMSPMKMFEYLASGTPVVSSDLPVLREILTDNVNALLVSPKNTKQWELAIRHLFSERKLAKKIGLQGHKDYLEHHTWSKRAEKYLDLINIQ